MFVTALRIQLEGPLDHPAGRALISDWSGNRISVQNKTKTTFSEKTIYQPVKSEVRARSH